MRRNTKTIGTARSRRGAIVAVVAVTAGALLLPATSGCIWAPELARLRKDLQRQIPQASFEKEFELSLGPVAIGMARMITGMVPDDDAHLARDILGDVRHVEIAVYNAHHLPDIRHVQIPERLERMQNKDGWEMAVKVRDNDEVVWLMYRMRKDTIRDVYVVVLNDEELIMVKATGHLDNLVARALKETHGIKGIPEIEGEGLTAN